MVNLVRAAGGPERRRRGCGDPGGPADGGPGGCYQWWVGGTNSISVFRRAPRCDFPAIPLALDPFSFDSVARPFLAASVFICPALRVVRAHGPSFLIRVPVSELLSTASTHLRESHVGSPPSRPFQDRAAAERRCVRHSPSRDFGGICRVSGGCGGALASPRWWA